MKRTVILACSARKLRDTGELSALARYDGPQWRTLRANMTSLIEPPLALSAEYGLIPAHQMIPDYNRPLTRQRVEQLVDQVSEELLALIRGGRLQGETFVYGGELYRSLILQARELARLELRRDIPMIFARGGIGQQLGQLKEFLTREPKPPHVIEERIGQ